MPNQTRDHRKAAWVSTGGRRKIDHLVPVNEELRMSAVAVQRTTFCGKREKGVWTPVIPAHLVKCMSCQKSAAKRNVEIVEPS